MQTKIVFCFALCSLIRTFAGCERNFEYYKRIIITTKKKTMKRKDYQRPTAQVVKLQQTGMLMTSGEVKATMDGTFTEEDI